MKKIFLTLATFAAISVSSAQAPEGINYQAVVRDISGNIIPNQNVSYRISILQGSINGNAVYTETHNTSTNDFGLTHLKIGEGTVVSGAFNQVDWSADSYYVLMELDENGGSNYTTMGTSQLMSVPYALHAKTAETAANVFSGDYNDLSNQPTIPTNVSDLTNDSGFITNPNDADADATNELQTLSVSGNDLTLSGGNTVTLPIGADTDWTENGSAVYNTTSDIGIGTSTPATSLDVVGDFKVTDGSQGDGRIMVSNAIGQTTWASSLYAESGSLNNNPATVDNTWTPLGPAITYTKSYDKTTLEVSIASRMGSGTFSGASGVRYQLMVNGSPAMYNSMGAIRQSNTVEYLSFESYFTNLPAGTYTIQVHAKTNAGTSTGVSLDPVGWGGKILIKEAF